MYESTLDAESTISRPNTVSRPNTASTRWKEASGRVSHAVSGLSTPRAERRLLESVPVATTGSPAVRRPRDLVRFTRDPVDRVGERPAAVGVVGEHVHRCGRGCEQHDGPRMHEFARQPHRLRHAGLAPFGRLAHRYVRRVPGQGFGEPGAVVAQQHGRVEPFRVGRHSSSTSAPLSSPPAIHTTRECARRAASAACGFVALESST